VSDHQIIQFFSSNIILRVRLSLGIFRLSLCGSGFGLQTSDVTDIHRPVTVGILWQLNNSEWMPQNIPCSAPCRLLENVSQQEARSSDTVTSAIEIKRTSRSCYDERQLTTDDLAARSGLRLFLASTDTVFIRR